MAESETLYKRRGWFQRTTWAHPVSNSQSQDSIPQYLHYKYTMNTLATMILILCIKSDRGRSHSTQCPQIEFPENASWTLRGLEVNKEAGLGKLFLKKATPTVLSVMPMFI